MVSDHFAYKNNTLMQYKDVAIYIRELLQNTRPSRIIEIGTAFGGFSFLLRDLLDDLGMNNDPLTTCDIKLNDRVVNAFKVIENITYIIKNVFKPANLNFI